MEVIREDRRGVLWIDLASASGLTCHGAASSLLSGYVFFYWIGDATFDACLKWLTILLSATLSGMNESEIE